MRAHSQLLLFPKQIGSKQERSNGNVNKLDSADRPFHDWYRFVLSFPPHLVRNYLDDFGPPKNSLVLDPFCGTGTTLVEAKQAGFQSIGIEANTMAHFASNVKVNWDLSGKALLREGGRIAKLATNKIRRARKLGALPSETHKLLLTDSICAIPLHKSLILRDEIREEAPIKLQGHLLLALAKTLVYSASNLHFGPEVGVRGRLEDCDVVGAWLEYVGTMAKDLMNLTDGRWPTTTVHHSDSRKSSVLLVPNSIGAVFTSPPYPNEKDYTRTTRLESIVLGFISTKADLRSLKKNLLRSNTRNVYKDDDDDKWIAHNPRIQTIANKIEARRIELGKTSGFERLYSRVVQLYFGGMARHLAELRPYLKRGARLGYVVGDQASYLRVMIRTGSLLGEIAEKLGYQVERLDLFRTRLATATKEQIREEVLVLRWDRS